MFRLQLLPAARGDCLWLEYGPRAAGRIVIVDGGLRETANVLLSRMEQARHERGSTTLEVELLVVTHIDNDHILGIIELLTNAPPWLHVRDIWFNGWPQLSQLPGAFETEDSALNLLGPREGDLLSQLLEAQGLPWNRHPNWDGQAIVISNRGNLPAAELAGGLRVTVLGPRMARLKRLRKVWSAIAQGTEITEQTSDVDDGLLGRGDSWPPVWRDDEQRDSSIANASSIMLLAEHSGRALLLAADGYASDLSDALQRLCIERSISPAVFPLSAFKLSHHGSARNLSRAILERIQCKRYLISTDGSGNGHPDHQALLRILRYSSEFPELMFNYACETTKPWQTWKSDVLHGDFQDYQCSFPTDPLDGITLEIM